MNEIKTLSNAKCQICLQKRLLFKNDLFICERCGSTFTTNRSGGFQLLKKNNIPKKIYLFSLSLLIISIVSLVALVNSFSIETTVLSLAGISLSICTVLIANIYEGLALGFLIGQYGRKTYEVEERKWFKIGLTIRIIALTLLLGLTVRMILYCF